MLASLIALVRDVGASLLRWRATGGANGRWEGTQFHALADRWAHQSLCDGLARIAADIPIVSEEAEVGEEIPPHKRYWIIDPIDGTASYAGGFPGFVTQLALIEASGPSMAAVFAPAHGALFVAERGRGAFKNGVRLRARTSDSLTLVDNYPEPRGIAAELYRGLSFSNYLESGSIGLKICRVADGSADLFFKTVSVRDWDLAAPQLILEEAGGCLLDAAGHNIRYGLANRQHTGLIAATDTTLARRVESWYGAHCAKGSTAK